jgi:hypothetical protein
MADCPELSRENGLTSASATGMTLPHVHDVLIKWLGQTPSRFVTATAILAMIEAWLFLLS